MNYWDKEVLSQKLNGQLPGAVAQLRMAPTVRFVGQKFPDQSQARRSSVLILLHHRADSVFFPLIQRPVYNGAHSGQIGLPGGKSEPHDQSAEDTALRETREELGIDASAVEILGKLTQIYIPVSNFIVEPFVGWWHSPAEFNPDAKEVAQILQFPLPYLVQPEAKGEFTYQINDIAITAPCYFLDDKKIWGATAMILSELKEILLQ